MSHLDEGTLHALLDGELGATELLQIEAHLGTCAACGSRLRDARDFFGEADRLVATVQFSGMAADAASAPAANPAPAPRAAATPPPRPSAPPPPPTRPQQQERPWEEEASPVLLIPDNPESAPSSRRWPRVLGLAATIALAVGAGYMASRVGKPSSSELAPAPRPTMARTESQAVASPAESDRAPTSRDSAAANSPPARVPTPSPAAVSTPPAAKAAPPAPKPKKITVATKPAPVAPPTDTAELADQSEEAATRAAEQEAVRLQAANALNQLDRERRAGRAAAATARLDQSDLERRQRQAAAGTVAPAAPPPPPTLEQRAQVYLRIGLDEANRQLGGPVHVIEGMSPTLMGLAPGRVAAGADTSRPVVRVVYQDAQGRMIVLDQQRRAGQPTPPSSSGAWSLGDVTVGLKGEVSAEVLRSLRSRVR